MHNMCKMKKTHSNNKTLSGLPKTMVFYLRLLNPILSIKLHLGKALNYCNLKMECCQLCLCLTMLGAALPKEQSGPSVCPCTDIPRPLSQTSSHFCTQNKDCALHTRKGMDKALEHQHQLSFFTQLVQAGKWPHSRLVLQCGYRRLDFKR